MKITEKQNSSKGNVEVEGVNVPDDNIIVSLLKKYKDKLGPDAVDSLLYIINRGVKEERDLDENNNTRRRGSRK